MPVHKVKILDGFTEYQQGHIGKFYKDPRKAYASMYQNAVRLLRGN